MADEKKETPATADKGYSKLSKKEIDNLKSKYPQGIFELEVDGKEGKVHYAYLRKPSFTDLQRAKASENRKPLTFNLSVWENCKIEGDPLIDSDDYLKAGALSQLDEIVEFAEARVKKL